MAKMSLRAARVNSGITQKEAAKKLGISNSTLGKWEKGTSFPNVKKLDERCELYGITYNDLIFLPGNPV